MFEDDDEDAGEGEEPKKSVEEYGFTKEKYEVDGYKGYRLVKKINNIDVNDINNYAKKNNPRRFRDGGFVPTVIL